MNKNTTTDRSLNLQQCRRGHSMADAYVNGLNYRVCRTCRAATQRRWAAKRRAQIQARRLELEFQKAQERDGGAR